MSSEGIKDGAPVLLVADVEGAANYYRDQLGFRYDQLWGDPPGFCILWRGPVGLMLSRMDDPAHIVPHRTVSETLWDAYFWVEDARAMHDEFVSRGATIEYPPTDKPYGCLELAIRDLDGYTIAFGQEL
ncbi:MAG: VOC family protein [Pseudomonadota bacterium]